MSFYIKKTNKGNKDFPSLLEEIPSPPKSLYYKGNFINKDDYCVAIVGTRKAGKGGLSLARKIAKELAKKGIVIVSGLALGIDKQAHVGALEAGGKTIAVLGNGLDKVYPKDHKSLAKDILNNKGCLVSEYKEGTDNHPKRFLARNRIISGLSKAVVIVEAPIKSGAISTATHAANQNREVFVVPGPADNDLYNGSHKLIRDGARLVTSSEDILEDLGFNVKKDKSIQKKIEFK